MLLYILWETKSEVLCAEVRGQGSEESRLQMQNCISDWQEHRSISSFSGTNHSDTRLIPLQTVKVI